MRAVHTTAREKHVSFCHIDSKDNERQALTEENLQDKRPRVALSRGRPVGSLPHEIGSHGLDNICKVVTGGHEQRPLLRIVGADFVDPAQDEWASSESDLAKPIHDLAPEDVVVEWHLAENDAKDQLVVSDVSTSTPRQVNTHATAARADQERTVIKAPA